jgi:hypothetical protein
MRFSNLVVTSSAAAVTQATCYVGTVADYGLIMDGADAVVEKLCSNDLASYFDEGQTKYHCLQQSYYKIEFWVRWTGYGGLSLKSDDCKKRLRDEIDGCTNGGESTVADWYFR